MPLRSRAHVLSRDPPRVLTPSCPGTPRDLSRQRKEAEQSKHLNLVRSHSCKFMQTSCRVRIGDTFVCKHRSRGANNSIGPDDAGQLPLLRSLPAGPLDAPPARSCRRTPPFHGPAADEPSLVLGTTRSERRCGTIRLLAGAAVSWSLLALAIARGRDRMKQIEELFQMHRTTF
jgi:hypothetical protein